MTNPEEHQIRQVAYELWRSRGRGEGFATQDWLMAERYLRLSNIYEVILNLPLSYNRLLWLHDCPQQQCRFCRRSASETTFSKKAHAIPESLGNKALVVNYECDECNQFFGNGIENDLACFTLPLRTLIQVSGKRGVPVYKSTAASRIKKRPEGMEIKIGLGDNLVERRSNNQFDLLLTTLPFVPLQVFKAFTKMALSVMPPAEIVHFQTTFDWVRAQLSANDSPIKGAYCYQAFTPAGHFNDGGILLYRRRESTAAVPYMMFVLVTKNMTYQIPLLLCKKDEHLEGKDVQLIAHPAGLGLPYHLGEAEGYFLDLGSPKPRTMDFRTTIYSVKDLPDFDINGLVSSRTSN